MKKITICLLTLLLCTAAFAQPPKPPTVDERLNKLNEVLQQQVKPTAIQKTGIENIFKTFFAAADKLRKDNPPPPKPSNATLPPPPSEKARAAMHKLEEDRDESVRKILSVDQFKKYKKAAEKLRPPRPGGRDKTDLPVPKNK